MTKPLEGIRVLDFSRVVAGPFATRMLSDLGADVVKVEPPDGDLTRLWGDKTGGLAGYYTQQNAGKRNICIDLKAEGARELLLDLAAKADIVVENYRPGVMKRFGLSYDNLRAVNESLIMLSISGFGQESSQKDRAAFAPILHAESGLLARQARFDEAAPNDPMLSIADTNSSLHGLVAVLAALHMRTTTGAGQHIDMAMLNAMTVTDDFSHYVLDKSEILRLGGYVWPTSFGYILVSGNLLSQWFQISRAGLLSDGLSKDAPVETKAATRKALIGDTIAAFGSLAEVTAWLDTANIAWAEIREPEDVFDTDIAAERRLTVEVDNRVGGVRRVVESPYHFSNAESSVAGPAPYRGEHNAEVLADWLGLSAAPTGLLQAEDRQ